MSERNTFFFWKRHRHNIKPKQSDQYSHGIFPPLPEITLPGWFMIRNDNAFPVRENEGLFATRFSIMHGNKQEGFADLLKLPNANAQFLTWIQVNPAIRGRTFGTQLLTMVQNYLRGTNSVGFLLDITPQSERSLYERNGWQKVSGSRNWRSYNRKLDPSTLRKTIEDATLYLIDYERAARGMSSRRRAANP